MVLLTPTEVDQSARMPGGLLAKSLPAPSGWEKGGLLVAFHGCAEPVVADACVVSSVPPNQNGQAESFPTVVIRQGSMCSTTGAGSVVGSAVDRYLATADYGLSKQLQTDDASVGSPKLDDATPLGTVADADFATAMSCLEQAAASSGFGAVWVVHTTVRGASYLAQQGLMTIDGFTPAGAKVIIGTGYANVDGTTVPMWATGQVWASVSAPEEIENVSWRQNNDEGWGAGLGVVAFDPCMLTQVNVTVPACPTP